MRAKIPLKPGKTHPKDLLALYKNGVEIYSLGKLDAKLFVIGKSVYTGSTNVSSNSASGLKEILYRTSESKTVIDAREFIESNCGVYLGPEELKRLQSIYRPPKNFTWIKGNKKVSENKKSYFIYKTPLVDFTEKEAQLAKTGREKAKYKRVKKVKHTVDEISWG